MLPGTHALVAALQLQLLWVGCDDQPDAAPRALGVKHLPCELSTPGYCTQAWRIRHQLIDLSWRSFGSFDPVDASGSRLVEL
jgi:hypothetical protein